MNKNRRFLKCIRKIVLWVKKFQTFHMNLSNTHSIYLKYCLINSSKFKRIEPIISRDSQCWLFSNNLVNFIWEIRWFSFSLNECSIWRTVIGFYLPPDFFWKNEFLTVLTVIMSTSERQSEKIFWWLIWSDQTFFPILFPVPRMINLCCSIRIVFLLLFKFLRKLVQIMQKNFSFLKNKCIFTWSFFYGCFDFDNSFSSFLSLSFFLKDSVHMMVI